jgi:Zn-dependent protease
VTAKTIGATDTTKAVFQMLSMFITINLFLAIFNFLPLHPLDGGKVLARFLPAHVNIKLEQNEHITSLVLLVLVMSGALRVLVIPVEFLHNLMITLALGVA